MTLSSTPPLSLFSQVLLHKDLPQWAAGEEDEEGWVARGGDHLLSPWEMWINPSWMEAWEPQGHASSIPMAGTPCSHLFSACSTCCPRRPSRLCGNQPLTCGCGSPTRWGCHVSWAGTFWEPVRPEEPSETVCRVSPLFCPLLSLFFWFPYHTRNAVPLPSRCQVDYAACHTLAPLYLLFNLFLVKSLNWCTVITATWILSYHFIWTNQSPVKCVLKHIIHNSTQINKAAGRGAGIDSHPFSWGFFLQFVLKGLQGCIHSQLVSAHCFIFFLSLLLLFMVHHFYCRRFWKGLCVNL